MRRHYLDHASTSPLRPPVVTAMAKWLSEGTAADPGRVHHEGRVVRHVLEESREAIAAFLGTRPRQVVLTSGGTEAVHTAVWGATRRDPGGVVAVAPVEHSAVREASARWAALAELAVDAQGRVLADSVGDVLERARRAGQTVALVHCQYANHEVGTMQPVREIVARCREAGVLVHVDACAAVGQVPLDLDALDADLVSVTAHKMGGPSGVGALVVRRGLRLEPLFLGGAQERARRAGLEHVVGAVGFAAAAGALTPETIAAEERAARARTDALTAAAEAVPGVTRVGDGGLPNIACLELQGVEGEPVLLGLDQVGIAAHSGSSCASETLEPSPVLRAMGLDAERSLRLSVGWSTTDEDVAAFAAAFPDVVRRLRELAG
ncbi:MAG TPA: aminotransferase class V-fold PLP-dependent enzyme [Acidimicrobiales bacterium]|nr:aminotransferase class V-fold PLP-dependent enzyme [Acidimicrobiales bacterium]